MTERKHKLGSILPTSSERVFYCDHIEQDGERLFRLACENDLEGIVVYGSLILTCLADQASWLKIRNRSYSQWAGREEPFERERERDPDVFLWDDCVRACEENVAS